MKLKPSTDVSRFLQDVQKCRGEVWFTTLEGDNLNLKSALSRFVFAAAPSEQLDALNGDIRIQDRDDLPLLEAHLL